MGRSVSLIASGYVEYACVDRPITRKGVRAAVPVTLDHSSGMVSIHRMRWSISTYSMAAAPLATARRSASLRPRLQSGAAKNCSRAARSHRQAAHRAHPVERRPTRRSTSRRFSSRPGRVAASRPLDAKWPQGRCRQTCWKQPHSPPTPVKATPSPVIGSILELAGVVVEPAGSLQGVTGAPPRHSSFGPGTCVLADGIWGGPLRAGVSMGGVELSVVPVSPGYCKTTCGQAKAGPVRIHLLRRRVLLKLRVCFGSTKPRVESLKVRARICGALLLQL